MSTPSSVIQALVALQGLDALLEDASDAELRALWEEAGFRFSGLDRLRKARARLAASIDPEWVATYERLLRRFGRAVVPVKNRVCMGCFVSLPTSAQRSPPGSSGVQLCDSCGRILHWI